MTTSQAGAKANAIWMTLIKSAKANDIDPSNYLSYLLKNIPELPTFANSADLEAYLPWNFMASPVAAESLIYRTVA